MDMEVDNKEEGTSTDTGRQRFYIELRPGETTIVSWRKLLKDAAAKKANSSQVNNQTAISASTAAAAAVVEPASVDASPPTPAESQFALGQTTKCKPKIELPSSRFGSVIEKIERLYVGNQSSDEELDGVPDEDQYDTEDSFIDDTELDEYFEVDESITKHNGFFVNKGELEQMNKPISSTHCQPKKRRKKMQKGGEEKGDDGGRLNAARRNIPLVEPSSTNTQCLTANGEYHHEGKLHLVSSPLGYSERKPADPSMRLENSSYSGITIRDHSITLATQIDTEKQMTGVLQSVYLGKNVRDPSEISGAAYQKYKENSGPAQLEPQSKRLISETSNAELSPKISHRNKKGRHELPDLNLPHYPAQAEKKTAAIKPKNVSSLRPKGTMLERAIKDLEKMVAQSTPRTIEVKDADTSSSCIKRRLPPEVKQRLGKVARLASSQGKISEELIDRLMSIVGHLVQLRTLKRNLREMVEMGLTAKQEKADRFQQIKKEVVDLIKLQESKQRDKAADDSQKALVHEEQGGVKGKYGMDNKMEDRICDLYDLYVQGMDEDKGPHMRKLYVELAELWPNGAMDNHGIKRAILRAKERRRAFYNNVKAQEKVRVEKLSSQRKENNVSGKATSIAQAKSGDERLTASAAICQHLSAGSARPLPSCSKGRNDGSPIQEKVEKMTFPMLKEKMKQQRREFECKLKKSSKVDKESHKSHKQDVGRQDGSSDPLTAPLPSSAQTH